MKISLDWLKEYLEFDLPLAQLVEKLNMIGLLVEDWKEIEEDIILDIETYANRPDTLGHLGVAREVAASLNLSLKRKSWPLTESEEETPQLVDIQIKNADLCPRYCGIVVRNIQVGPSPAWLRRKIEAMGLNPTNNVVDVTNYVLFSTSHPIHAFDLEKIEGRSIIIRSAEKGEVLRSLEGKEIALSPEMLVIADEEKPVALAGVIGGEESGVEEATHNVFIESAYFDPISIRKTSKKTGILTDASYRFERGADIDFPPQAALMAASLLAQMGGLATQGIMDVYPKPKSQKKLVLRNHRISELLGMEVDKEFVLRTLPSLGFDVKEENRGIYQVKIPSFRVDIERETDLVEEIARFYGYDKIPSEIPPLQKLEPVFDPKRKSVERLRQLLFHQGFDEFMNFSFFDPEKESLFETEKKAIEIRNPVSSRASLLRTTLVAGLLENVLWNKNRGVEGVHAFEIGNIYFWEKEKTREQLTLAIITTGYLDYLQWQGKSELTDFFHLKGTFESLMENLRYEPYSFQVENHPFFEQGYSLSLSYKGERIGHLGLLRRDILDSYSLEDPAWAAELDLSILFEKQPQSFRFSPVAKFPSITRDVSFIADRDIPYQKIEEEVEKLSIPHLETYSLYDIFSGSSIPKGKVSLSLRFVFRHPQRTLQAEEVDKFQERIIKTLKANFSFQLREGGKIDK